jgi:hypothetical protein
MAILRKGECDVVKGECHGKLSGGAQTAPLPPGAQNLGAATVLSYVSV